MKIKELIGHLEEIYKKHGDLYVLVCLWDSDDEYTFYHMGYIPRNPVVVKNKDNMKFLSIESRRVDFLVHGLSLEELSVLR